MAVHVHYNSWYISLPSSAKQQREMTPGGGGVLPYMGYIGMCGPKG